MRAASLPAVTDASRAVGVASSLLSKDSGAGYAADIRAEYEKIAHGHANQRAGGKRLTFGNVSVSAKK